jgi:hypothetical protein
VDLIHVALGLRVVAVALYPPPTNQVPRLLVIADDLPAPSERGAFLARLTPPGSLDGVEVVLRSADEFLADPASLYVELAANGRVMVDRRGVLLDRLSTFRADAS